MTIHIFCRVIDNWGDLGVCLRLATQLVQRGVAVTMWHDAPPSAEWLLGYMPPALQVRRWEAAALPTADNVCAFSLAVGDCIIEAFGCTLPSSVLAAMAQIVWEADQSKALLAQPSKTEPTQPFTWLNLEYLSAEGYVQRSHGLPSPQRLQTAGGETVWVEKRFFYPGFTEGTGGLLREPDLLAQQVAFYAAFEGGKAWLRQFHAEKSHDTDEVSVTVKAEATTSQPQNSQPPNSLHISLFCYEPPVLLRLVETWVEQGTAVHLYITAGRAAAYWQSIQSKILSIYKAYSLKTGQRTSCNTSIQPHLLPQLSPKDYERLLWSCDFNFVRGEDSLVSALWAGKPFVWQLYPQEDGAHLAKLDAFLQTAQALASTPWPSAERRLFTAWNDPAEPFSAEQAKQLGSDPNYFLHVRYALMQQTDLCAQLIRVISPPPHQP